MVARRLGAGVCVCVCGGGGGGGGEGYLFPLNIYLKKTLKKSSWQKPLDRFQYGLAGMFLCRNVSLVILFQDCSSHHDSSKSLATKDGAYFPYRSI